ncbi:hypothetical protein ES703_64899 [subsurface metagenome]
MRKTSNKENALSEYNDTFIQPTPRFAIKLKGNNTSWKTINKFLEDKYVKAHLNQDISIATLSKWYPSYAILDIDNRLLEDVGEIRDILGLDEFNSMLCSSESSNSYHLLFKPTCNNKPPTIRFLKNAFIPFVKQNKIEIYPQANRPIRSPFGWKQFCLDFIYQNLPTWEDKYYWWKRLNDYDVSTIPFYQQGLDLSFMKDKLPDYYEEGKLLLKNGLQRSNSRNESQFKILYYLWRNNIPFSEAIKIVLSVIKTKHNGFSKEVNRGNWRTINGEITRQASKIYSTYELSYIYPDTTHNSYCGYITKPDIPDIIRISKGNLPEMKFLFQVVKYCNPRRHRIFLNIHSDKLIEWSSKETYLKRLDKLKKKGIIKRGKSYSVDKFSKSIDIKWDFRDTNKAILIDNRSPNTFEDNIRLSYEPNEIKALLEATGVKRVSIYDLLKKFYEVSKKDTHIITL